MTSKLILFLLKPRTLVTIGIVIIITSIFAACGGINGVVLNSLSTIKSITGNKVDLEKIENSKSTQMDNTVWDALLKKHVHKNGDVNYEGFISDQAMLDSYLNQLSSNPPKNNASSNEKMAYWINAYNAFTVKLIIENYPVQSIKDIAGNIPMVDSPWDIKFFIIGGQNFDLNTIEHEILRKEFNDPRIHFAINCASFSCPRLRNEAFNASSLEAQLEEQTTVFINNPAKNTITENSLQISKIFDWFKSDFKNAGSVQEFIAKYAKVKLDTSIKIHYRDYDWSLNKT